MKNIWIILITLPCFFPDSLIAGQNNFSFRTITDNTIHRFNLKKYRFNQDNYRSYFYLISSSFAFEGLNPTGYPSKEKKIKTPWNKNRGYLNPQKLHKNHGLALIESIAFMSVSAAMYWWRWGLWSEDWQYSFTWEEQKLRFFTVEATKFDSNSFMTNFSHGPNGAIFYNFARTNHLSVSESCLYALTTSLFWEYVIEYKEIISINDNLFNAFLGFSMGEPLFQLGNYLSHQPGTANKILGIIFNPILALNNWLSGKKRKKDTGDLRFYQHRSSLIFGPIFGDYQGESPGYSHFNIGFESQLVSIPGYQKPGISRMKLKKPFFSEIFADMNLGTKHIEEFNIMTKATLLGYYKKNIKSTNHSRKGYQFFLGLGSAYDMFRKKSNAPYDTITSGSSQSEWIEVTRPTEFSDKWAVINTLGPIFEYSLFLGKTSLKLTVESYFNFALVNSMALREFSTQNNLNYIKSTLAKYGYYYACGFTALSSLVIQHEPLRLQAKIKYHHFDSIEGLDRFQDQITDDFHLRDSRLLLDFSMDYRLNKTPISLRLGYQGIIRQGTIENIRQHEFEKKIYLQFILHFL